jgi:hypothetical protein
MPLTKQLGQFSLKRELDDILIVMHSETTNKGVVLTSEFIGFPNYRSSLVSLLDADQKRLNVIL